MTKNSAIVVLLGITAWARVHVADAQVITYSPVVTYGENVVADTETTTTYYAPSEPVTTYYAPSEPVTTYYAPSEPVTTFYAPTSTPVTTYYAPVTTYYAPPVTTYFAPSAPVTTYYAPAPATQVVVPTVPVVRAPYWVYDPTRILPRRRWRLVVP